MSAGADGWLWCQQPREDASHRLICFPHAGGSAAFFRAWADALPGVEVHAVRYPGRAERIAEDLATDLVSMARDIAQAVAPLADRPISLFGHSMGAAVALETARALEAADLPVAHLFASGSRDAPLPEPTEAAAEDPESLIEELTRLGGTDASVLDDPAFVELVLPYVLGDSRLFHAYRMTPEPILSCPVSTIVGTADDNADLRPWAQLTRGPVTECDVPGDHFYLTEEPPYTLVMQSLDLNDREQQR